MSLLRYFQKAGEPTSDGSSDHDSNSLGQGSGPEHNIQQTQADPREACASSVTEQLDGSLVDIPTQPTVVSGVAGVSDIAAYIEGSASISDAVKYQLLVNHFKPGHFPRDHRGVVSSIVGSNISHGLFTASRKMGGSVFPVFFLQLVGIINLLLVFLFGVP